MNSELAERRRYPRSEFAYPVEFQIFAPHLVSRSFIGYLRNLSMGGACIHFEDRYGRLDPYELEGCRMKLSIDMPQGEKIFLFAVVSWVRKDSSRQGLSILMGLEFEEAADRQLERIKNFISEKNKDHKMMWNLWEQHLQQR